MKTHAFKTSLKCEGCLSKVIKKLETVPGIIKVDAELNSPDRVLRITVEDVDTETLIRLISEAGYKAELL